MADEKKTDRITIRLQPEVLKNAEQAARDSGQKPSVFVREAIREAAARRLGFSVTS